MPIAIPFNMQRNYHSINNVDTIETIPEISIRTFCKEAIKIILAIIGVLVVVNFAFILLGVLIVLFNTIFEYTIVQIFGQEIYNKNFPVCTNKIYSGNNCYTTQSTYCY
jgi:hypothetical protein